MRGRPRGGRRGKGEGSLSERADGRWHVRVPLGRGIDGKRRYKHAYAETQADAIALLRWLGGRAEAGQLTTTTSTPTVGRRPQGRRRGKGEGSLSERADGRWHVRVPLGRGINGKRRYKHAYAVTQAAAIALLRRLGGKAEAGQLTTTSTPTIGSYLNDWFLTNQDQWRPTTRQTYRVAIDQHLVPAFGHLRVEQCTGLVIQRWLNDHKQAHGARARIEGALAVLRSALRGAQALQLVTVNHAQAVTVPTRAKRKIRTLTAAEAKRFLRVARAHRLGALFTVALACGLRHGEALGLPWDAIDFKTRELHVRQQLQWIKHEGWIRPRRRPILLPVKSEKSHRTITLPTVCFDELQRHRTQQRRERLKAGARWTSRVLAQDEHDPTQYVEVDGDLVYTTYRTYRDGTRHQRKIGAPLHPRNVGRVLAALLTEAKLPPMRFHDLRHSAASILIAAGVQLAEVSALLGHSELRLTSDLYVHLQQQTAAKAARIMDAVLK